MLEITPEDRSILRSWVISFHNDHMVQEIQSPLRQILRLVPASAQSIISDLSNLMNQLLVREGDIDPGLLPLLKRAVIWTRRQDAASVEDRSSRAHNVEVLDHLKDELVSFSRIMEQEWFKKTEALRAPVLSDYVTVSHAEERLMGRGISLDPRVYDEKFSILLAPALFLPDLAYFRSRCELRDQPVVAAYLDIDGFKAFNEEHGHERVDRDILPRFMSEMERHVFSHGSAYRIGGDEYLILLPNMTRDNATRFLYEFQRNLEGISYLEIEKNPTVSIGMCEVPPGSELTDREVREKADQALAFAKGEGRNRIATFNGDSDARLIVVDPSG